MDRIVLDELKTGKNLSKYCCLAIDEAHKTTMSIDLILGLIKKLLQKCEDLKLKSLNSNMIEKPKIVSMRLAKISQPSAKQRAGRARRTNEGFLL